MTVGIVGYGSFGKLCAQVISKYAPVLVYDKNLVDLEFPIGVKQASFARVAACNIIFICVGLASLEKVCERLKQNVSPSTITIDVCATKIKSIKIMKKHLLGHCQLLSVHPLFGPQTIKNSLIRGKSIVFFPIKLDNLKKFETFLTQQLGLNVIKMSPEEHDREMAWVHGLTFFIGRGLLNLNLPKNKLTTGYYQQLLGLVELEKGHSIELFNEVQQGNPYAAEVRKKLFNQLNKLESEIESAG